MEVRIRNFRGQGAREAKQAVFRHFSGTARQNWHYYTHLDEITGTAVYGGFYLSKAWTGRDQGGIQFPLWAWRRVAAIKPVWLSDKLLRVMKRMAGMG